VTTIAEAIAAQALRFRAALGPAPVHGYRIPPPPMSDTERLGRRVMREVDREYWRRRTTLQRAEYLTVDVWDDPVFEEVWRRENA
jgi:hypothetical protein